MDADGRTLYLFTNDSGGTSSCVDACAQLWPPAPAGGDEAVGDGLDAALLSAIERPDGSTQLAYGGHPLYRYTPDASAGDVNGQGVGGVWFAVDASGEAVQDATADPASTQGY